VQIYIYELSIRENQGTSRYRDNSKKIIIAWRMVEWSNGRITHVPVLMRIFIFDFFFFFFFSILFFPGNSNMKIFNIVSTHISKVIFI
jgi:hypothetical protein